MYAKYFKRSLDFILSLSALIVLSPVFVILIIVGAIVMRGNPFFVQPRPGKDEKIFNLIKFRTMTNARDKDGNLLPDDKRLTGYGKMLRKTSLDELPELLNIIKGDMSIVGPRPLAVQYLPYYTPEESQRHSVRPGLTGLAQVSGRNLLNWPLRFALDVEYVKNITFATDVSIVFTTVLKMFKSKDIATRGTTDIIDFDVFRQMENSEMHKG